MSTGSSCGICLRLVGGSECPSIAAMEMLPNCDQLHAEGELCEGDGECDTVPAANNCNGNGDVYMRCTAAPAAGLRQPPWPPPAGPARPPPPRVPPSPPQPPLSPLPECAAPCEAGAECGACLQLVPAGECPAEAAVDRLPHCVGLWPGELCEGDGECGTAKTANNCHGYRDVYKRAACVQAARPARSAEMLREPLMISAALLLLLIIAGVRSTVAGRLQSDTTTLDPMLPTPGGQLALASTAPAGRGPAGRRAEEQHARRRRRRRRRRRHGGRARARARARGRAGQ